MLATVLVFTEAHPSKQKRFFPRFYRFDPEAYSKSMNENSLEWLENIYRNLENSPVPQSPPKEMTAQQKEIYDILQEIHDLKKRGIL